MRAIRFGPLSMARSKSQILRLGSLALPLPFARPALVGGLIWPFLVGYILGRELRR